MQWAVQVAFDAHLAVDKNMKMLAKVTAWKKNFMSNITALCPVSFRDLPCQKQWEIRMPR